MERKNYPKHVGIFKNRRQQSDSSVSQESLEKFIRKFQGMFPGNFEEEINGTIYSTTEIRTYIASLAETANVSQDQQLLHFIARACLVASEEFGKQDISIMAQTIMDDFGVSLELRKRYSHREEIVRQVTVLGVASIKVLERNPKYSQVLEYISEINQK